MPCPTSRSSRSCCVLTRPCRQSCWQRPRFFEGDRRDERTVFEAVLAPLAAEAGLPFTYDEMKEFATEEFNLSDDELAAVAGGAMNDLWEPETDCLFLGIGISVDACSSEYAGAGACHLIGVGFLHF